MEKAKSVEAGMESIIYDDTEPQKQGSPCSKLKAVFSNITIEPILILHLWPSMMSNLTVQNLNLEKACRVNLAFDDAICNAMSVRNATGYSDIEERSVQKLVATMNAYKSVVQSLIPSLFLLFMGSWSDRHGRRKPFILLPVMAEVIATLGFLVSVYFFYQLPIEFNSFFEAVPSALVGGWSGLFMGVFCYISGVTSVETRTVRMGAVTIMANISMSVGIAMSGIMYNQTGFYGVFFLSLGMYICGVLYGYFRLKETPKKIKDEDKKGFVKDFFDLRHVKETFRVAMKKGKRNRRLRILASMILAMVVMGPIHGEMNVLYLFVRYKFGWNEMNFSLFSTFNSVLHMCGTAFSLMFFTKVLKLDDAMMGLISCLSKIASAGVYAFAPNPTIFYLGSVVEVLNGTSFIAMRSIVSKLVPPDEHGKVNSLFGVCEALMPLVYGPMYSVVYRATMSVLPGSFFLLGGALTIPAAVIFLWLYLEHRGDMKEEAKEKEAKELLMDRGKHDVTN